MREIVRKFLRREGLQKFMTKQFSNPSGVFGRFIGNQMAKGNVYDVQWTLSLLDIQRLLLRLRLSRAGWWIAANVLGWGLLSLVTPGESIGQFGLLVVGFLPACTTAAVLAWLLKEVPEAGGQAV